MSSSTRPRPLPWLAPGQTLPEPEQAWGAKDPVPGLLAAGGSLDASALLRAYQRGIFPWFSDDQPILWWSPDPRMVLQTARFRVHRSLARTLRRFVVSPKCQIRFDHDFEAVIQACSQVPRSGQSGTWILPDMIEAYLALHRAGHAHSVETWVDGELVGGLYCVGIGRAVFGESMFALRPDASKIALAALVAFCLNQGVVQIDCQQNTSHLASLGAAEMPRSDFLALLARDVQLPDPQWHFEPVYWNALLTARPASTTT